MARSVHAINCKLLMRNYTFYMGLDHSYIIATIFGLKNKLVGVAKMGKKCQNRPKNVFFLPLGPEIERQVIS